MTCRNSIAYDINFMNFGKVDVEMSIPPFYYRLLTLYHKVYSNSLIFLIIYLELYHTVMASVLVLKQFIPSHSVNQEMLNVNNVYPCEHSISEKVHPMRYEFLLLRVAYTIRIQHLNNETRSNL